MVKNTSRNPNDGMLGFVYNDDILDDILGECDASQSLHSTKK